MALHGKIKKKRVLTDPGHTVYDVLLIRTLYKESLNTLDTAGFSGAKPKRKALYAKKTEAVAQ
jgi:hypothetical protein